MAARSRRVSIQDAYSEWSSTYDQDPNLTRDLDETVTREMLEGRRCGLIVELGCGTGKNTAFLARIAGEVKALDFSPGMIARAKEKLRLENVAFAVSDLTRTWPCADASADLVVSNLVLEHIQDLRFVFAEAARVLRNEGCFFVSELHPFRQYLGGLARFRRGEATTEIPAFVHHLSEFTSAAETHGFRLDRFREAWHAEDRDKPPRLATFLFRKSVPGAH